MPDTDYTGLLFIGDPHLEGRQPGFRKDDYPKVILEKLAWCLDYAATHRLLPAILGDLFDKPRDNPNWMLVELFQLLRGEVLGLYGNHDVHYHPELTHDDTLSVLVTSGRIRLLSPDSPWRGTIEGRKVIVGGSSYRQPIPQRFDEADKFELGLPPLVIWLTHHDIAVAGYDEGRITPYEVPGVDLVINGHIHRSLDDVCCGQTAWLTPGNISRRSRNDASRDHVPSVLRLDVEPTDYRLTQVPVPHRPWEEVFHPAVQEATSAAGGSLFVAGLAELQRRRTASGAGLIEFLQQNANQFEAAVAAEIMALAKEVTREDHVGQG
jgi:hypothetical protein